MQRQFETSDRESSNGTGEHLKRPDWDEYFMAIADIASKRSTCLATPVGAVIVSPNKQILSTGYNGVPSGIEHCTDRGNCYDGVAICSKSSRPSMSIHAEVNAIAQAAKSGISINMATIYVTMEPCLNCLKLIVASGISKVVYRDRFDKFGGSGVCEVRDRYLTEGLIDIVAFGK